MTPLEQEILRAVKEAAGCKGTQLPGLVDPAFLGPNFIHALEGLITAGEVLEVSYALPESDYRLRSFLLPKGTQIQVSPTHFNSPDEFP